MSDMSGSFADASWRERDRRHPRMMLARIEGGRMRGQDIVIRNISKLGLGAATQGIFPFVGGKPNRQIAYWADDLWSRSLD